jgi:uncharacterized protein
VTASFAAGGGTDAAAALEAVERFLLRHPVHNSLVLGLLQDRVARPEPGRYWWVRRDADVVAFAFQSPLHFRALVSPADPCVLDDLVARMAAEAPQMPGIMGDAATAAAFAGRWAERRATPVLPVEGQRIYRLNGVRQPPDVPGRLRRAGPEDREVVVGWMAGFLEETGMNLFRPEELFDRHVARGLWLWEADGPVSMAASSPPTAGMSRIGFVYTPPEHRRRGFAAACVAALSTRIAGDGLDCILNTQLQNPTSNAIYRRIGYEPAAELLIYRFG